MFASKYLNVGAEEKANLTAAQLTLNGSLLAQRAIGVGVLLIINENTTGLICATFAAVRQRRTVLAAEAVVFTVATLIVRRDRVLHRLREPGLLSQKHLEAHIGDPGVLRAVVGRWLYLAVR